MKLGCLPSAVVNTRVDCSIQLDAPLSFPRCSVCSAQLAHRCHMLQIVAAASLHLRAAHVTAFIFLATSIICAFAAAPSTDADHDPPSNSEPLTGSGLLTASGLGRLMSSVLPTVLVCMVIVCLCLISLRCRCRCRCCFSLCRCADHPVDDQSPDGEEA